MKLPFLNESLYSDLLFDYNKNLKSYIARTKDESISVTPGFGPFVGYFKVTIEDGSEILYEVKDRFETELSKRLRDRY